MTIVYLKRFIILLLLMIVLVFSFSKFMYNQSVPSATANGEQLYTEYCSGCHRASGSGNFFLGIPPVYEHKLSRAKVVRIIRKGDPDYSRMPVFPQIRFSQAQKIVDYLEQLEAKQR